MIGNRYDSERRDANAQWFAGLVGGGFALAIGCWAIYTIGTVVIEILASQFSGM